MATLQLIESNSELLYPQESLRMNPSGKKLEVTIRNADPGTGIVEVSFEGYSNTFYLEEKEIVSFSILDLDSELTIKNIGETTLWVDWL
jgi:hypothetical protein